MTTRLGMAQDLLRAYASGRETTRKAGPGECVEIHLRGPEGKPAWITGIKLEANFQGSEEEVAKFQEELAATLKNVEQQVEFQNMLKLKLNLP